jgi:hypothetical protein
MFLENWGLTPEGANFSLLAEKGNYAREYSKRARRRIAAKAG